jgi:putative SOS response-associated peptidase YedK
MCGRFNLRTPASELAKIFALIRTAELRPRYNIAPTQPVAAIRQADDGRELALITWGLIPSWADDPQIGSRMINARAETVAAKPSFRSAFKRRRCLIPADGFYEWKQTGAGKGPKQPFHIGRQDGKPFAMAGLWERWAKGAGPAIESCTIITTDANSELRELHDRMPVIIPPDDYDQWLNPNEQEADALMPLLAPYHGDPLEIYPVSRAVNNPRHDDADCVERIEAGTS